MNGFRPVLALGCAILLSWVSASHAEDAPDPGKPAAIDAMVKGNPYAPQLQTMARDLYNTMGQAEARRLVAVRTGFGMIRAVETGGGGIDQGRALCGKANPSLKSDLDRRYGDWRGAVQPAVDNQVKRMQAAISKRNFDQPDKVRAFLDQLDKVTQYARQAHDKDLQRVTTPEACRKLGESMTENGPVLATSLEKINWPGEPGYGR